MLSSSAKGVEQDPANCPMQVPEGLRLPAKNRTLGGLGCFEKWASDRDVLMDLLIVQISDLHAGAGENPFRQRCETLALAAAAEADAGVGACVLVFNGDAAYGGKPGEFEAAAEMIGLVRDALADKLKVPVHVVCVPGNHDCDVTSEDEEARKALRNMVGDKRPAGSVERQLLQAQDAYFAFAQKLPAPSSSPSPQSPYYVYYDVEIGGRVVRFHLLNSAWTSLRHEREDLRFPVEAFCPPPEPEADYAVTVIHHPVHWFAMPAVRRPLRSKIEAASDLVLVGHEHENEKSRRALASGEEIDYLEGGVLQEHGDPERCGFNAVRLDLERGRWTLRQFLWSADHFEPVGSASAALAPNPRRSDRRLAWTAAFADELDELEDPLAASRRLRGDLRLAHLFVYPDLRKVTDVAADEDAARPPQIVDYVRGGEAAAELVGQRLAVIMAGDKFGKTSLAKRLVHDLRRDGRVPLLIRGSRIPSSGSEQGLRQVLQKEVARQYEFLTAAAYEQLPAGQRAIVIDDLEDGPDHPGVRRRVLDYLACQFGSIYVFAGDDFRLEVLGRRGEDSAALLPYQRYEICEFGHLRLRELATRWANLGDHQLDPAQVEAQVTELCAGVEQMLALAGMPHTPYLLCAIMDEIDSADSAAPDLALKNGSYGPLYHAAITKLLSRSSQASLDLGGKFTYLAEVAYALYSRDASSFSDAEARDFHREHCDRFKLDLDFGRLIDDLVDCRILRRDGGEVAFRHKYTYCYFVARWLERYMNRPGRGEEAKRVVGELAGNLHHDVSANVLVFLAHLRDDPLVLETVRAAATALYDEVEPADLGSEVAPLNRLDCVEGYFTLPPSPPDVNRKLIQEAEDERRALAEQGEHDGRDVRARPNEEEDVRDEAVAKSLAARRRMRAAFRAIKVLGQIARNGASSMEGEDKRVVMEEVVGLGRRVMGMLFGHLANLDLLVREVKHRYFAYMLRARQVSGRDRPSLAERKKLAREADVIAKRYWFDLYWLATLGVIKLIANATGLKELDTTLADMRREEGEQGRLPLDLIELQVQFNRRTRSIPADRLVKFHERLVKDQNKLARVVIEAMTAERLLLHEVSYKQKQQVCEQMGIKVPVKALDRSRKKFSPTK